MNTPLRFIVALSFAVLPFVSTGSQAFAPGAGKSLTLGSITFTGVSPRIVTPNGDGANDKALFRFDNPDLLPVTGRVYDLTGSRVASLSGGADPLTQLLWDGKNTDGQTVPGGIYLYEIDFQGEVVTGTVVVAR